MPLTLLAMDHTLRRKAAVGAIPTFTQHSIVCMPTCHFVTATLPRAFSGHQRQTYEVPVTARER